MTMSEGPLILVAAGALTVLLAGCAGLDRPAVERVASAFATGDAWARCELLAPATRSTLETSGSTGCTEAVGQLPPSGGEVRSASIWGDEAQVQLADDTLFLTRTSTGWKVVAAGCTADGDAPYKCRVVGP
jgi:hypothetical protein